MELRGVEEELCPPDAPSYVDVLAGLLHHQAPLLPQLHHCWEEGKLGNLKRKENTLVSHEDDPFLGIVEVEP